MSTIKNYSFFFSIFLKFLEESVGYQLFLNYYVVRNLDDSNKVGYFFSPCFNTIKKFEYVRRLNEIIQSESTYFVKYLNENSNKIRTECIHLNNKKRYIFSNIFKCNNQIMLNQMHLSNLADWGACNLEESMKCSANIAYENEQMQIAYINLTEVETTIRKINSELEHYAEIIAYFEYTFVMPLSCNVAKGKYYLFFK